MGKGQSLSTYLSNYMHVINSYFLGSGMVVVIYSPTSLVDANCSLNKQKTKSSIIIR